METPSSRRTVSTSLSSKKQNEDSLTKSRPVLLDITNDSPIVGLAKDRPTPASAVKSCPKSAAGLTPGSGESLLRSQVNSLLQRVEEGGKISSAAADLPRRHPPFAAAGGLLGFFSSPSQILAPTPANTPQVPNLSGIKEESNLLIPEQQIDITLQVEEESQINRMLTFDSPGKSEESSSASSAVTYQGTEKSASAAADDDSSSAWSIQANASSALEDDEHGEDDIESHDFEQTEEEEAEEESEEEGCGGVDDLCDFLGKMTVSKMTVNDDEKKKFAGRHMRFVYNSDGEMESEVEVTNAAVSPGVVVLKGLPVPEGKHLRFPDDEDDV